MNVSDYTTSDRLIAISIWIPESESFVNVPTVSQPQGQDILRPLRQWLDNIEVKSPELAHRLCKLIPSQCPFERTVSLFGRKLFHIPPLCKLNPFYDEFVGLRFRALCYLVDVCGEDVSQYC
jgi:Mo-dependent nitrogenase C-terminus